MANNDASGFAGALPAVFAGYAEYSLAFGVRWHS
jgi:hypothetical protein